MEKSRPADIRLHQDCRRRTAEDLSASLGQREFRKLRTNHSDQSIQSLHRRRPEQSGQRTRTGTRRAVSALLPRHVERGRQHVSCLQQCVQGDGHAFYHTHDQRRRAQQGQDRCHRSTVLTHGKRHLHRIHESLSMAQLLVPGKGRHDVGQLWCRRPRV